MTNYERISYLKKVGVWDGISQVLLIYKGRKTFAGAKVRKKNWIVQIYGRIFAK